MIEIEHTFDGEHECDAEEVNSCKHPSTMHASRTPVIFIGMV